MAGKSADGGKKPRRSTSPKKKPAEVAEKAKRKSAAAKRKAGVAVPAVPQSAPPAKIFQIYYEPFQRELVEPGFIPLDNRGKPSSYLEFDIFNRLFLSEHVKDVPLWGALSWRFTEKTGLTGADLFGLIEANSGYDVYFCNPYPKHEALFHNLWVQGETAHPDFLDLARAFLKAAELPVEETDLIWPPAIYSSANYFIGTPAFWERYLAFVGGTIRRAERGLPADIWRRLHSTGADDRNLHGGSSYMPFIVERIFPLFMRTAGRGLKGFKLPLTVPEQELDVHLRLLRQMKEMAHKMNSPWLAACWANYRILYFQQFHGQEWTRKYLRSITPPDIKFA